MSKVSRLYLGATVEQTLSSKGEPYSLSGFGVWITTLIKYHSWKLQNKLTGRNAQCYQNCYTVTIKSKVNQWHLPNCSHHFKQIKAKICILIKQKHGRATCFVLQHYCEIPFYKNGQVSTFWVLGLSSLLAYIKII